MNVYIYSLVDRHVLVYETNLWLYLYTDLYRTGYFPDKNDPVNRRSSSPSSKNGGKLIEGCKCAILKFEFHSQHHRLRLYWSRIKSTHPPQTRETTRRSSLERRQPDAAHVDDVRSRTTASGGGFGHGRSPSRTTDDDLHVRYCTSSPVPLGVYSIPAFVHEDGTYVAVAIAHRRARWGRRAWEGAPARVLITFT